MPWLRQNPLHVLLIPQYSAGKPFSNDHPLRRSQIDRISNVANHLRVLVEAKVLLGGDDAESVGVAHAATPALNADDGVAAVENAELDGVHDTPLQAAVDILLPRGGLEVGLLLVEVEGVHATVQVRVLRKALAMGM